MTIIGLTTNAKQRFQQWLDETTNATYGSFEAVERFNTISNFYNSEATYEHSRNFTKSGNPELFWFESSDFEYEQDAE